MFISYAANQFERLADPSRRPVLIEEASKRLKERSIAVAEQNGLDAYWIDFLRAPNQPEATDNIHRFCDGVRGSKLVCVLLAEDADMANSLAAFGKRLWCLPECLLAPKHEIYVQGGGESEVNDIMQLPSRAWTKSYINNSNHVVKGKGRKDEFRLLAEHFSGLRYLSPIQQFWLALSAMRSLDYFPFQKGDRAYGGSLIRPSRSLTVIRAVWYRSRIRWFSPIFCSSIKRSTRIIQISISTSPISSSLLELSRPTLAILSVVVRQSTSYKRNPIRL